MPYHTFKQLDARQKFPRVFNPRRLYILENKLCRVLSYPQKRSLEFFCLYIHCVGRSFQKAFGTIYAIVTIMELGAFSSFCGLLKNNLDIEY